MGRAPSVVCVEYVGLDTAGARPGQATPGQQQRQRQRFDGGRQQARAAWVTGTSAWPMASGHEAVGITALSLSLSTAASLFRHDQRTNNSHLSTGKQGFSPRVTCTSYTSPYCFTNSVCPSNSRFVSERFHIPSNPFHQLLKIPLQFSHTTYSCRCSSNAKAACNSAGLDKKHFTACKS